MKKDIFALSIAAIVFATAFTGCQQADRARAKTHLEKIQAAVDEVEKAEKEVQKADTRMEEAKKKLEATSVPVTQDATIEALLTSLDQFATLLEKTKAMLEVALEAAPEVPVGLSPEIKELIKSIQKTSPKEAEEFLSMLSKTCTLVRERSKIVVKFKEHLPHLTADNREAIVQALAFKEDEEYLGNPKVEALLAHWKVITQKIDTALDDLEKAENELKITYKD